MSAETEHDDLYLAVQRLSEQVDAVAVTGSPLAAPSTPRPTFRKSKQRQREAAEAESLSEQVDAVIMSGSPLAAPGKPRPSFRKSKQKQREAAAAKMATTAFPISHHPSFSGGHNGGNESGSDAVSDSSCAPRASAERDQGLGGVHHATLRNRLIKTLDKALAENIAQNAPHSRHSTPLIFAQGLIQKFKRVSGQSKLVPTDTVFDEVLTSPSVPLSPSLSHTLCVSLSLTHTLSLSRIRDVARLVPETLTGVTSRKTWVVADRGGRGGHVRC